MKPQDSIPLRYDSEQAESDLQKTFSALLYHFYSKFTVKATSWGIISFHLSRPISLSRYLWLLKFVLEF